MLFIIKQWRLENHVHVPDEDQRKCQKKAVHLVAPEAAGPAHVAAREEPVAVAVAAVARVVPVKLAPKIIQ